MVVACCCHFCSESRSFWATISGNSNHVLMALYNYNDKEDMHNVEHSFELKTWNKSLKHRRFISSLQLKLQRCLLA